MPVIVFERDYNEWSGTGVARATTTGTE